MTTIIIISTTLVCIFAMWALYRMTRTTGKTPGELLQMSTNNTKVPPIQKSKFFPDRFYPGKALTLDPALKAMTRGAMFAYPTDPLLIEGFAYFSIDGNQFEEIRFDKIGDKRYLAMYDSYEEVIYMLNHLMTVGIMGDTDPAMVSQETIVLTEAGIDYTFSDFSGLLDVGLESNGQYQKFVGRRLIRVYARDVGRDEQEFLVCIMDTPGVVEYWVGFQLNAIQLED